MMRSKTVELFLALSLSATLVACGSGGSPEAGEGEDSAPTRVESEQRSNEGGEGDENETQEGGEGGEGGES